MNTTASRLIVGLGQLKVVNYPCILVGMALGSCVGMVVYDLGARVGGLAHIMLPMSSEGPPDGLPAKFADRALPLMLEEIERAGGNPRRCRAKLIGGAQMFMGGDGIRRHVGERNVEVARVLLSEYGIPIVGEDTGGEHARTVEFDTGTMQASIRTIVLGKKLI